jgi:hypothetical protein
MEALGSMLAAHSLHFHDAHPGPSTSFRRQNPPEVLLTAFRRLL